MNAVRQVYENLPKIIKTPAALENRRVEVIMLPLDEDDSPDKLKIRKNINLIDEFAGAWEGETLVRPEQGAFEKSHGTPIGPNDLLIAAIALSNKAVLITHNTGEFERVAGLKLKDWEI